MPGKFSKRQTSCESTEYVGAFAAACGHNVARNLGVSLVGGWKVTSNHQKLTHGIITSINTKFCSFCCRLARIPMSNNGHPIRPPPPVWGLGWTYRESKMVPIEMSSPHSYSTPIHTIGLSCNVWPKCTMRQTDERHKRSE